MRAAGEPHERGRGSVAQSRRRRVEELRKGNTNSLRHGAFAKVQAAADVAVEIALTMAAHPGLDPIADRRLVEQLAETRVTRQRILLAMDVEGLTPTLTAFMSKMAPLEERLERSVYDRERQRVRDRAKGDVDPLARYRSGASC